MHSKNNYSRIVGENYNNKTNVFHTCVRAITESGFKLSKDGSQAWHRDTPEMKYNVLYQVPEGTKSSEVENFRTSYDQIKKGQGCERANTHKDTRLKRDFV